MDRRSVADEMESLPINKRRRTRTAKSEQDVEPTKDGAYACKMLALTWNPDGRECVLRGTSDKDRDPVWITLPGRRWGYPPINNKNQGQTCWFCYRIWLSRYKCQLNPTLQKMPAHLGLVQENKHKFVA